eukprot:TRINITY_DN9542_c0_g1_i1.p1 TRINITY_DN9542_c0_g1~~TRINITY_DN9542_c0_g1_i1.p1  ORF type:complete len:196 (-),score=54.81 TRINITY_DN9542_c0_g1_i1:237-824(-)
MPGVVKTTVGYTGGWTQEPTYSSVCSGDGHSEALRIEYNPELLSYQDLLQAFFEKHSPSSDHVAQYASIIFPNNDEQDALARQVLKSHKTTHQATEIRRPRKWWDAEESHQKFVAKQEAWAAQLAEQAAAAERKKAARRKKQEMEKAAKTKLSPPAASSSSGGYSSAAAPEAMVEPVQLSLQEKPRSCNPVIVSL